MLPGILREASILFWLEFFCCCSNQYSRQLLWEGSQLIAENISASADTVPIIGHDLCYPVCEEAGSWEYMEVAPWLEKSRQWDK